MACYLITYDLDRPGQNYHPVVTALQQAGGVRVLLSTWLIVSNEGAGQIRDRYRRHIDANDRLFVTDVNNWAYSNIMNPDAAKRLLPP